MISIEEYKKQPCAAYSLPYWKQIFFDKRNDIVIVHDKDFNIDSYGETGELYFRLYHNLHNIKSKNIGGYSVATATENDFPVIVDIINRSYDNIKVNLKQVKSFTQEEVYKKDLWIIIKNSENLSVACGIADLDKLTGEVILEWIQVLPEYRKQGIGEIIVSELLKRASGIADFATVSGQVDNLTNPERLYRKCGFTGNDVWHIIFKS